MKNDYLTFFPVQKCTPDNAGSIPVDLSLICIISSFKTKVIEVVFSD